MSTIKSIKVYHKLKEDENYTHAIVPGFMIILGIVCFLGISDSPKNYLMFFIFCSLAVFSHKLLKTTKPITIKANSICLGKMVVGYKPKRITASDIYKIELVDEKITKDYPKAWLSGGVAHVYSSYFLIYLKDNKELKFDNVYDKELQDYLKEWCLANKVEVDFEVKKIIDVSSKDIFE